MESWLRVLFALLGVLLSIADADSDTEFETCDRPYQKVGCFHEGTTNMTLIINDRDGEGIDIIWTQFEESIHSLACRCSKKAKAEGYQYFSIRFWAECWAGKSYAEIRNENMEPSGCKNTKFRDCTDADKECVGKAHFEYMYKLAFWSEWHEWSECSVPCNTGTRTRERTCNAVGDVDTNCAGIGSETQTCKEMDCPTCIWKDNKVGIGSSEELVPDIETKEDCLDSCLRKKSQVIDAVNFIANTPPQCYCVTGVLVHSEHDAAVYCKLQYGII